MLKGNRAWQILDMLKHNSQLLTIRRVNVSQKTLAETLGITRQALQQHLKHLRNEGLIRTGRGFIDITEKDIQPETITIVIDLAEYLKKKYGE